MTVDARQPGTTPCRDGSEDEPGQLERRGERGHLASRGESVLVGRVGARLADGAQRGGDAAMQFPRGFLDLGEGQRVEAVVTRGNFEGCWIVRGHGVL